MTVKFNKDGSTELNHHDDFSKWFDNLECEINIKIIEKCKPKLELEIGDIIILDHKVHTYTHYGKVLGFGPEDVMLKWEGNSNTSIILIATLNRWLKDGKLKIYKEVSIGDLSI